jgi:hypothetical protein
MKALNFVSPRIPQCSTSLLNKEEQAELRALAGLLQAESRKIAAQLGIAVPSRPRAIFDAICRAGLAENFYEAVLLAEHAAPTRKWRDCARWVVEYETAESSRR